MLYFIGLILPPVAVVACGKPLQALLNIPLTLLFWLPGVFHAWAVIAAHHDRPSNLIIETRGRDTNDVMPLLLFLAVVGIASFLWAHPSDAVSLLELSKELFGKFVGQGKEFLQTVLR